MKKLIDFFKNHKRRALTISLISLILLFFIITIPLAYKSSYCKHPLFDKDKLEFSNPLDNEYINLDLKAISYIERSYTTDNNYQNGNLKISTSLSSKKREIKNVSMTFLLTSYWDKEWETTKSETTASTIDKMTNGQKPKTNTYNIAIKQTYPLKPILFVKVEHPTLYVKITFDIDGVKQTQSHELYFKYEYSNYITSETVFE